MRDTLNFAVKRYCVSTYKYLLNETVLLSSLNINKLIKWTFLKQRDITIFENGKLSSELWESPTTVTSPGTGETGYAFCQNSIFLKEENINKKRSDTNSTRHNESHLRRSK